MIIPFKLKRTQDISGVSGAGYVAEGIITDHGPCVLMWYNSRTISTYADIQEVINVHGHGGLTTIEPDNGLLMWAHGHRGDAEVTWLKILPDGTPELWVLWNNIADQRYPRWRRPKWQDQDGGCIGKIHNSMGMGLAQVVLEGVYSQIDKAIAPHHKDLIESSVAAWVAEREKEYSDD